MSNHQSCQGSVYPSGAFHWSSLSLDNHPQGVYHLWHVFSHPTQHLLDVSLRRSHRAAHAEPQTDVLQTSGSIWIQRILWKWAWSSSPVVFLPESEQRGRGSMKMKWSVVSSSCLFAHFPEMGTSFYPSDLSSPTLFTTGDIKKLKLKQH